MLINSIIRKRCHMIFGSNSRNLSILTSLIIMMALLLIPFVNLNLYYVLISIISFYVLNILGIYMTLHRYYSHKAFEFKNDFYKIFFTLLAILCMRGSVLGWVYIHREHHAYSDTDRDPHTPKNVGFKLFGYNHFKNFEEQQVKLFLIKDLMTKEHLFVHKYYLLIILCFVTMLGSIDLNILYFGYVLPCLFVHLSQNLFNYYGHTTGYRNFVTKDNSTNNAFLFPLLLGECWHNNHHHSPKNYNNRVIGKEYDPLAYFILSIGKVSK